MPPHRHGRPRHGYNKGCRDKAVQAVVVLWALGLVLLAWVLL
jgi:hypothetical protein